jgi:hypothetical protein
MLDVFIMRLLARLRRAVNSASALIQALAPNADK